MSITVSWQPYPSDVPPDERTQCAAEGCERPGEIVEVRSPSTVRVVSLTQETTTTVWCIDDARRQGYEDAPAPLPTRLNGFQRWVVRTLGGTPK
ncbi:MAG TPA: hypothetical protein VHW74_07265 [Mycobacteriales bacterium]|nr:hypothetical protein [Mycobacteriales bacterium]